MIDILKSYIEGRMQKKIKGDSVLDFFAGVAYGILTTYKDEENRKLKERELDLKERELNLKQEDLEFRKKQYKQENS
jgi:hypothetical protein